MITSCRFVVTIVAALTVGGCGGGAEAPADEAATETAPDPFSLEGRPPEAIYGVSPADNLWSPRFELGVPGLPAGWEGARLALLTDFQIGLWPENEDVGSRAVQLALEAEPDLIVLLGDYLATGDDLSSVRRILEPLRGRRAIAVLGDRDIRSDSVAVRTVRMLEEFGVSVLRNSVVQLEMGGDSLRVAGLDPALAVASIGAQQAVVGGLAVAEPIPLLLSHAPALATRAPVGRFHVVLGGNTFCGTVEVPGSPRLSWLAAEAFPNGSVDGSRQIFQDRETAVLVSCGLGYGFVPLRFGAAPEVPIVTLVRAGGPEPEIQDSAAIAAADSASR